MAWSTPKTDWDTDDAVGTTDLNRIEGNIANTRIETVLAEGTNATMGTGTIPGGGTYVDISTTKVTSSSRIFVSYISTAGNTALEAAYQSTGVFRVYGEPSGTFNWLIINPA